MDISERTQLFRKLAATSEYWEDALVHLRRGVQMGLKLNLTLAQVQNMMARKNALTPNDQLMIRTGLRDLIAALKPYADMMGAARSVLEIIGYR
jgi:hypothetical protein